MRFELTTLVVIGTHCIGSYKSNYHTIMTTTAPKSPKNLSIKPKTHINISSKKYGVQKNMVYRYEIHFIVENF